SGPGGARLSDAGVFRGARDHRARRPGARVPAGRSHHDAPEPAREPRLLLRHRRLPAPDGGRGIDPVRGDSARRIRPAHPGADRPRAGGGRRMTRRRIVPALVLVVLLLGAGAYYVTVSRPTVLVLTGIVTTNDVVVSPQIGGQIGRLLVQEGDTVTQEQLLAVITPDELAADRTYYAQSAEGATSQVKESEAALRYQERQTRDQIRQADAMLASTESQRAAAEADLEIARLSFERNQRLVKEQLISVEQFDQARTTYEGAGAKVDSLKRQADAQRAAVALARSTAGPIAMKRHQPEA